MPFSNDEINIIPEKSSWRKYALYISILFFSVSLITDAYCSGSKFSMGFMLLVFGWLGIFSGAGISWLANPFLLITWILMYRNNKSDWIFGLIATLFSLSFLLFNKIISDEAGNYETITSIGMGYWFWLTSCFTAFIGSVVARSKGNLYQEND